LNDLLLINSFKKESSDDSVLLNLIGEALIGVDFVGVLNLLRIYSVVGFGLDLKI